MPRRLNLSTQELRKLVSEENSCVLLKKDFRSQLLFNSFNLGIIKYVLRDLLYSHLPTYEPKLGGIVLGYDNIRVDDTIVHDDLPSVDLSYTADVFVFAPDLNSIVSGVVSKKTEEHLCCLVHGIFTVTVVRPVERQKENKAERKAWKRLYKTCELGDQVSLLITLVEHNSKMPYIRAVPAIPDS